MNRLRRFLSLPAGDRRLFVRALLSLWAVRLGLWVLPFGRVRRAVAHASRRRLRVAASVDGVMRAVDSASRFVVDPTCLVRALSAKVLLGSVGAPAELRIGVAREGGARLQAHAWVACDGRVVVGGEHDLSVFTLLPSIDGEGT